MTTESDYDFGENETWNMGGNETWNFNETGNGNSTDVVGVISLNFLDSFVKALSVMLVSELGDKTFFLAGW